MNRLIKKFTLAWLICLACASVITSQTSQSESPAERRAKELFGGTGLRDVSYSASPTRDSNRELADTKRVACDRAHTLRVLFVGNSFTYVHNVPALVQGVASSLPGPCVETSMIASGGATLEDHWHNAAVASRIREGHWTHVVLNDQSTFGEGWWLEGKARVGTSGRELMEFGERFSQLIRQSGAIPVFLAHWANADAPARDQQALDYMFARVARETDSEVAQAGLGIKRMQVQLPSITPYFTDNHHLSPAGAYLEAMIIYSTLTKRSPVGAAPHLEGYEVEFNRGTVSNSMTVLVDIPAREAAAIQRIAKLAYSHGRGRPPAVSAPAALNAEFPTVPANGDKIDQGYLRGHWRGVSLVLPNPDGEVTIDFSFTTATELSHQDTLELSTSTLRFAGRAMLAVDGNHIVVRASIMPIQGPGRGHPQPLEVELRAVIRGGVMIGVATIQQRFADTISSFDAIGRFEAKRVGPPT